MKKVYAIIVVALIFGGAAQAQGLGNILGALGSATGGSSAGNAIGAISNVIYSFTGNTQAVDITGTWKYTGSAIALSSDNVLANVAGTAASTTAQNKVDSYLQMIGLTPGSMTFTFNEDLTFVIYVRNVPISGTWKTLDDGNNIQLQFGKTLKYFSITGAMKKTATGCQILFEGSKYLKFIKTLLNFASSQSTAIGAVSGLAGNYSGMKIGWSLAR